MEPKTVPSTSAQNGVNVTVTEIKHMSLKKKRTPKKRKLTVDQKIDDNIKIRDQCLAKIAELEAEELEMASDTEYEKLELIDKLKYKVLQIEQAMSKYVEFKDATYQADYVTTQPFLGPKIFITNSGLEPLNQMLTDHVNNVRKEDFHIGYRCVTRDEVKEMINAIAEKNDCPLLPLVIPSDESKCEEAIIEIVGRTNTLCRMMRINEYFEDVCAHEGVKENPEQTNDEKMPKAEDETQNISLNKKFETERQLDPTECDESNVIVLADESSDDEDDSDSNGEIPMDAENCDDSLDDIVITNGDEVVQRLLQVESDLQSEDSKPVSSNVSELSVGQQSPKYACQDEDIIMINDDDSEIIYLD
ncbi:hypothetical protein DdX_07694 [Ditylenchus destructor]|uniref:Uncharacterized protein n=1 Tax=Ditylenchus destructor TaxID=166010 RepID=A0AAD4N4G3_9BILA|nr:hypothetical protein DdX_07694 [Ditylenchus destructor]